MGFDEHPAAFPAAAASANGSTDGSTALCLTNQAYGQAANLGALENAITDSMVWSAGSGVDDTC